MTADVELIHPEPDTVRRVSDAFGRVSLALGGWGLPLLIVLAASVLRFMNLGHPDSVVPLDETYYARNGFGYLCHGVDMTFSSDDAPQTCAGLVPTFAVHPPVGKILIAGGIKIFGYNPFGWRAAAAFFGSLSVLIIFLIGKRLWHSAWLAAAAAVLLGVEGLQFVQSRLAMLDIFLAFFILLGIWLLLEDNARTPRKGRLRWWRIGAGAAFGLAVATKWSAVPILPVAAAIAFAWEVGRFRDAQDAAALATPVQERAVETETLDGAPAPRPPLAARLLRLLGRGVLAVWRFMRHPPELVRQAVKLLVVFAVFPALLYFASYTPWMLSTKRYIPPRCNDVVAVDGVDTSKPKSGLSLWACNQREIWDYHQHLRSRNEDGTPIHPYMSQAWSWPWISRPAAHYFQSYCEPGRTPLPCKSGQVLRDEEILGLPNPLIWWTGFFIALPLCAWWMIAKRDQTAALIVVLFLPLVLPWFVTTRPLFMFYMTPASPLLILMIVHMMKVWKMRASAVAYVILAVGVFIYFYPVLAAVPLPATGVFGWESRIWFGHGLKGDCVSKGIKLLCWI